MPLAGPVSPQIHGSSSGTQGHDTSIPVPAHAGMTRHKFAFVDTNARMKKYHLRVMSTLCQHGAVSSTLAASAPKPRPTSPSSTLLTTSAAMASEVGSRWP